MRLTDLQINLRVKDIVTGIPTKECPQLNYLIILGKFPLWGYRRAKELPNWILKGFSRKLNYIMKQRSIFVRNIKNRVF